MHQSRRSVRRIRESERVHIDDRCRGMIDIVKCIDEAVFLAHLDFHAIHGVFRIVIEAIALVGFTSSKDPTWQYFNTIGNSYSSRLFARNIHRIRIQLLNAQGANCWHSNTLPSEDFRHRRLCRFIHGECYRCFRLFVSRIGCTFAKLFILGR